jgi:hypothetical protein
MEFRIVSLTVLDTTRFRADSRAPCATRCCARDCGHDAKNPRSLSMFALSLEFHRPRLWITVTSIQRDARQLVTVLSNLRCFGTVRRRSFGWFGSAFAGKRIPMSNRSAVILMPLDRPSRPTYENLPNDRRAGRATASANRRPVFRASISTSFGTVRIEPIKSTGRVRSLPLVGHLSAETTTACPSERNWTKTGKPWRWHSP